MKKKKRGGTSKVEDGGESSPILGLPAPSAALMPDSTLAVSKPGLLVSSSGLVAPPDLEMSSGCSGGELSSSEEEGSSDEECPSVRRVGAGSALAKEAQAIPEAMDGIQSSGTGKVSGPSAVPNVNPKMGPWRNLFADNRAANSNTMLSHYSQIYESKSCILSDEDTPCEEWKRCLIGYVAGKYPGFVTLKSIIANVWKCDATLSIHENGWLVYEFKKEEDKMAVLNGGPYLIYGRPLLLKSMPEFFDFSKNEMSSVPVWVKLPNLPLKCWSLRSLSKISSLIGKPIQCDRFTASKARISYARVLIEVDLRESLPDTIQIGLPNGLFINQLVIFEALPQFCKACNSIGHSSDKCGKNPTLPVRGRTPGGIPPANGNVPRRVLRARSAGPVVLKSVTDAEDSNNAGSKSGLAEIWVPVGRKGKISGNVKQTHLIASKQPDAAKQPVSPAEDVRAAKGKGKEVLETETEVGGIIEPEFGQAENVDPKAPLLASERDSEVNAVNNPVIPKELDIRKSVRKPKKTAKGGPTSSAAK